VNEKEPEPTTVADQLAKAEACVRLLREYTEKVANWKAKAAALDTHIEIGMPDHEDIDAWDGMKDRYARVREACSELSSIVSGLIEQSRLPNVVRTELRLRLAEFETEFVQYQALFPDRYDLVFERLTNPAKKIEVIKAIVSATGSSLSDAKAVVENAPKPVKKSIPKGQAEALKKQLEAAGVPVSLRAV